MDIRPIQTEADYDWALAEIEQYFHCEPVRGTLEAARFDVLSALIGAYEDKRWPLEVPTAVEGIRAAMELLGKSQGDLAALLGSRSRASELLNEQRSITMDQAWKLHEVWGVPANLLLKPSKPQHA